MHAIMLKHVGEHTCTHTNNVHTQTMYTHTCECTHMHTQAHAQITNTYTHICTSTLYFFKDKEDPAKHFEMCVDQESHNGGPEADRRMDKTTTA